MAHTSLAQKTTFGEAKLHLPRKGQTSLKKAAFRLLFSCD